MGEPDALLLEVVAEVIEALADYAGGAVVFMLWIGGVLWWGQRRGT